MPVLVPPPSLIDRMSSPGPPGPHGRSLLERARNDPARGADGNLPLVLAREALLRFVGTGGLGALAATRLALQRDVRKLAAEVALREVGAAKFRVEPGRVAEWALCIPGARALAVTECASVFSVSVAICVGALRFPVLGARGRVGLALGRDRAAWRAACASTSSRPRPCRAAATRGAQQARPRSAAASSGSCDTRRAACAAVLATRLAATSSGDRAARRAACAAALATRSAAASSGCCEARRTAWATASASRTAAAPSGSCEARRAACAAALASRSAAASSGGCEARRAARTAELRAPFASASAGVCS